MKNKYRYTRQAIYNQIETERKKELKYQKQLLEKEKEKANNKEYE